MTLLAMILILAGTILFMAIPFFRTEEAMAVAAAGSDGELQALLAEKEATYTAIKDLHFDYLTGKLSEEDYSALQGKYEAKAIEVLKKIESSNGSAAIEEAIEEKILELRKLRQAAAPGGPPRGEAASAPADGCAECGSSVRPGASYCGGCGAKLMNACSQCGREMAPEDKFCSTCGAKLN